MNAEQYLLMEDNNSALIELRNALQLFPNSAEVNFRIAEIMAEEGMNAAIQERKMGGVRFRTPPILLSSAISCCVGEYLPNRSG